MAAWNDRPRFIGWATLAGLLLITGLAYTRIRYMLRPLKDIRAGALRFGAGDFDKSIVVLRAQRPDELGELAASINTMGADIHQMLEANLAVLVAEVVAGFNGALAVRQEISTALPILELDRTRMRLLLRNLMDNAMRHSAQAPRAPLIRVQPVQLGGISISVRDFGPGVSEQQIEHLAQPFYRLDAARERTSGGVGLGLYLCKLVVLAHGGVFSIANTHPGLEISVTLPKNLA